MRRDAGILFAKHEWLVGWALGGAFLVGCGIYLMGIDQANEYE